MTDWNHPPLDFRLIGDISYDPVGAALQAAPWIAKRTSTFVCQFQHRLSDAELHIVGCLLRQSNDIRHLTLRCIRSPETISDIVNSIQRVPGLVRWDHLQSLDLRRLVPLGGPLPPETLALLFHSAPAMRKLELNTVVGADVLSSLVQPADSAAQLDYLSGPLEVHEAFCTSNIASPLPKEISVRVPRADISGKSPSMRVRDMLTGTTPWRLEGVHAISIAGRHFIPPLDLWRLTRLKVLSIYVISQQEAAPLLMDIPKSLRTLRLSYFSDSLDIEQLAESLENASLTHLRRLEFLKAGSCSSVEIEFWQAVLLHFCAPRRIELRVGTWA